MNSEGIGLGLMISKALIEKNGGQLQIHSDGVGKGSVFAFSMEMLTQLQVRPGSHSSQNFSNFNITNESEQESVTEWSVHEPKRMPINYGLDKLF